MPSIASNNRMKFSTISLLAGLASLAAAQIAPQPPSKDPFYLAPLNISSTKPGDILRSRTIIPAILGLLPLPVQAWQLLYHTTDLDGNAIAAATTVFKPFGAQTDRFVTYLTAEDSAWIDSAPSYNYQLLSTITDANVAGENLLLQVYIAQGWIVSAPDYEGPMAAFTAGPLEGRIVLDSMRAVNNFHATLGLNANSTNAIAATGYSGGAIATGWAAQLHAMYAPELNVTGWYAGGTPANLSTMVTNVDSTFFSGFLPIAIAGLSKPGAYSSHLSPLLNKIITPFGAEAISYSTSHGPIEVLVTYPNTSLLSYELQNHGPALVFNPAYDYVMQATTMGQSAELTPQIPFLLAHALHDELVPYNQAHTLFEEWCAQGGNVHFTTIAEGGHIIGEGLGLGPAIEFITAAFNGTLTPKSGCSESTIYNGTISLPDLVEAAQPAMRQFVDVAAPLMRQADQGDLAALKTPVST